MMIQDVLWLPKCSQIFILWHVDVVKWVYMLVNQFKRPRTVVEDLVFVIVFSVGAYTRFFPSSDDFR